MQDGKKSQSTKLYRNLMCSDKKCEESKYQYVASEASNGCVVSDQYKLQETVFWHELSIHKMLQEKESKETNLWWWQEISIYVAKEAKWNLNLKELILFMQSVTKPDCKQMVHSLK